MKLTPGSVWRSAVSDAQVVVVRALAPEVELTCGGRPMLSEPSSAETPEAAAVDGDELLMGKRYVDAEAGLELLCTKAGAGWLACDGRRLEIAQPKLLPSSD
jgi:hypothetical protein